MLVQWRAAGSKCYTVSRDTGVTVCIMHCQNGLAMTAPIIDTRVLRTYQERRHDLHPSNTSRLPIHTSFTSLVSCGEELPETRIRRSLVSGARDALPFCASLSRLAGIAMRHFGFNIQTVAPAM
jgi:hypothetical protein